MIKVGVVRGGISEGYEGSLLTGGNVLSHLRGDKLNKTYKAIDILIDKEGTWHINGKPVSILDVFYSVDIVFNGLHGEFGEDGKVQQILNQWKIPYTGSGAFASALGYNKILAKEQFVSLGIKTPEYLIIPKYEKEDDKDLKSYSKNIAQHIHSKISPPWVVKPIFGASSINTKVCQTYPELIDTFLSGVNKDVDVLVEEMIEGKEAMIGVVNQFRDQKIYVLPSIETCIHKGHLEEVCPGNFTRSEKIKLEELASSIHTGFNFDHYSKSNFVIHPKKGIYITEVNTLPSLTDTSIFSKMLNAVGSDVPTFIDHLIKLTLNK